MANAAKRQANVYPTRAASMLRRLREPTKIATASPPTGRPVLLASHGVLSARPVAGHRLRCSPQLTAFKGGIQLISLQFFESSRHQTLTQFKREVDRPHPSL